MTTLIIARLSDGAAVAERQDADQPSQPTSRLGRRLTSGKAGAHEALRRPTTCLAGKLRNLDDGETANREVKRMLGPRQLGGLCQPGTLAVRMA